MARLCIRKLIIFGGAFALSIVAVGCASSSRFDSTGVEPSESRSEYTQLDAQLEDMFERERARMERERHESCMADCWAAGTCAYDTERDVCVATADGCAASLLCANEGRCALGHEPRRCVSLP